MPTTTACRLRRIFNELRTCRPSCASAAHAAVVRCGPALGERGVGFLRVRRVEAHPKAVVGLWPQLDRHRRAGLATGDAAGAAIGIADLDPGIGRGAERGIPGPIEARRRRHTGRVGAGIRRDDAAGKQRGGQQRGAGEGKAQQTGHGAQRLVLEPRDLVALDAQAGHQPLLAEDEGIDIVLGGGGGQRLGLAFVHHDDARADADLEALVGAEGADRRLVHQEHGVAELLRAGLQAEGGAAGVVVAGRLSTLEQHAVAVLPGIIISMEQTGWLNQLRAWKI